MRLQQGGSGRCGVKRHGLRSLMYPLFRDRILLQALTEIRNEIAVKEGIDAANLPPLRYVMKRSPARR